MTDIDPNMDETLDIEERQLEAMEKQEAAYDGTLVGDKESQQTQAEEDESVGGYSSDFQLEEARGLRCLPTTSLHHCLMGKDLLPEE